MEQQHHASAGAVHAPKTLDATLPQLQHSSDLLSRPAAPSPAAGGSVPHSEVKRCRNFMRSETVPHSIMVNYPFISPNRSVSESQGFYQLHAVPICSVIAGSPGLPSQHLQHISTPPRPSILRKRKESSNILHGSAKRRLPSLVEVSSTANRSTLMAAHASEPALQALPPKLECGIENTEESPRKRMRKQTFETDPASDQIKMAVDVVQPVSVGSEVWGISDHSMLMKAFAPMIVDEKKKRGRPRAGTRPATVVPVELHRSVSLFVDIDSPESGPCDLPAGEMASVRGSTASVPPVHLNGTKRGLAENLNRAQESPVENDVECGNGSTEECISLLNIWRREKNKFKKSGPSVYTKDSCSAGVGSSKLPATLRTALTSNEEQANDAVKVLVEFLRKTKEAKTFIQQLWNAALATPNLNKFFDMGAHAVVKIRLPVAPCCSGSNVRQLRRTSLAQFEVDLSDVESGLHEVMDLIDEMISFLTKEESHEATFCCTKRSFIRETSEKASQVRDRHKELERAFLARRSRARVLLEDDFHSVLRSAKLVPNGTVGLDDNVFTFPSEHRHKSLSFPDALASNILPYNCHFSLLQSFDGSPTIEMDDSMIDEELSIRVQHISQRLDGQMAIEENVLRSFKLLHSLYDREYRRDDRRGIESCDSETLSTDRRFRSLRFMLALPPSKLSPNRKLDFGDHCDSIINCPEGSDMNQHMLGISPFWKTAKTNAIRKSWRCTRAGRIMRDSQRFGYFPSYLLRDDYKEYYVEDLIDHCNQTRYRIDYNRMEQIWSHLERNVFAYKHHLAQNRRRLEGSRKNAELFKENLPVCLSCTQVEAEKFSEDNDVLRSEMEDFTNEGVSAREILATAFRAIHQTTVIMIQTRDAILELVHSILEGRENAAQQTDSVYDEELFTRQMEQTLQQSFEEIQSSSKMQH